MRHENGRLPENPNDRISYEGRALRDIYLAGGCFWGTEAYLARIPGVESAVSGYANGSTEAPAYEDIPRTGHAETVRVRYDPERLALPALLGQFFEIIDPTVKNRQGNDRGAQYRTGIYYTDAADLPVIRAAAAEAQTRYSDPVVPELLPLSNFFPAEEYHQKYLEKNPGGYCHVDFSKLAKEAETKDAAQPLRERLSPLSYHVTQENGTEPPFSNAYWDNRAPGLYVDIVSGAPLFLSSDKFDSGCGWPSFTRPLAQDAVVEKTDRGFGMRRTEVRSVGSDAHLGHVFDDGPREHGGLRYCINSAALRFIPADEMEAEGFGRYLPLLRKM